jgi:acetyl esterase/lipase
MCLSLWMLSLGVGAAWAEDRPAAKRTRDVIYGRKFGLAMTMDIFQPANPNGAGVILVISGGWFSNPEAFPPAWADLFLNRGYTVYAVAHGSQPKFTIPEIVEDLHRAVRFIRAHAKEYQVDPNKLGIMGISAGGHLSCLMGTSGRSGNPKATNPVDRESSKVQAVAAFCPPTDFLNYGEKGKEMLRRSFQPPFTAATDYMEFDQGKAVYVPLTDEAKVRAITRAISPIAHVTAESAPTLILHGDKDRVVPIQQAETLIARLKEVGVPAELVVRKDAGHVWPTMLQDFSLCADWFDRQLLKKSREDKPTTPDPKEKQNEGKKNPDGLFSPARQRG